MAWSEIQHGKENLLISMDGKKRREVLATEKFFEVNGTRKAENAFAFFPPSLDNLNITSSKFFVNIIISI